MSSSSPAPGTPSSRARSSSPVNAVYRSPGGARAVTFSEEEVMRQVPATSICGRRGARGAARPGGFFPGGGGGWGGGVLGAAEGAGGGGPPPRQSITRLSHTPYF